MKNCHNKKKKGNPTSNHAARGKLLTLSYRERLHDAFKLRLISNKECNDIHSKSIQLKERQQKTGEKKRIEHWGLHNTRMHARYTVRGRGSRYSNHPPNLSASNLCQHYRYDASRGEHRHDTTQ